MTYGCDCPDIACPSLLTSSDQFKELQPHNVTFLSDFLPLFLKQLNPPPSDF